jgi:hypothetical protein
MPLSQDGYSQGNANPGASVIVQISTTLINDLIVVFGYTRGGPVTGIADQASLTWTRRGRFNYTGGGGSTYTEIWWAISAGVLTTNQITVTCTSSAYIMFGAVAINGADLTTPFDTNVSLPGFSNSGTVIISTSNANDFIICGAENNGSGGIDTGFTALGSPGSGFITQEYKIVSATQSGLVLGSGIASPLGLTADAVRQAGSPLGGASFRRSLSAIGTRTGSRQAVM